MNSQNRFEGVFASDLMGFTLFDTTTGETLAVNDRFLEMTGHTRAEFEDGRWDWRRFTPAEYLPLDEAAIASVRETGRWTPFEKEYVRRDGSRISVRLSAAAIPHEPGRVVVGIQDITSERAAIRALEESEAHARRQAQELTALFDAAPIGLCVLDPDLRFVRINDLLAEVNGLPACDHLGRTVAEVVPDLSDQALSAMRRVLDGEEVWGVEFAGSTTAEPGRTRTWRENWLPLRDRDGAVAGVIVSADEITDELIAERALKDAQARLSDQRRLASAEAALRDADARYRAYFENTPEALFMIEVTPEGDYLIEETNAAHEQGVGVRLIDVQGRSLREILPEPALSRVLEAYDHVVSLGKPYQYREVFELRGRRGHWDTTLVPLRDAEGRVVRLMGSSRDVTPQVAAEEALRQSQKMEAMGQLTGGVAHDFNNLLTPIMGVLDRLEQRGVGDTRDRVLIQGALQSAERARTLVQRLLSFARRQPLQSMAVNMADLIAGMRDLLATTVGPRIELSFEVAADLPPAQVDQNQIEMALLNLGVNARDAMPDGGQLRVSARHEVVSGSIVPGLRDGDYVRLTVSDTGSGMDEATAKRAVEPFFSTKGIGRGTGLGLSMVHGLALQLGGALDIRSRPGVGTSIRLWLPVSDVSPAIPRPVERRASRGAGSVLLVDDEPLVRSSTADMLAALGYAVTETDSAETALSLLEQGMHFDLLVTDYIMPGLSGAELARLARLTHASLNILVVSGYAEVDGLAPDLARLAKPFRQTELSAKLQELMA